MSAYVIGARIPMPSDEILLDTAAWMASDIRSMGAVPVERGDLSAYDHMDALRTQREGLWCSGITASLARLLPKE